MSGICFFEVLSNRINISNKQNILNCVIKQKLILQLKIKCDKIKKRVDAYDQLEYT